MNSITDSLYNLRLLDDLARKETRIHRMHPMVKLLVTAAYLFTVISFGRYEIIGLLPLILYPVVIFILAELPVWPILKRVLLVEPLIIGIGILNPLFDHQAVTLGGLEISEGWITFLSIFLKCGLTVTAGLLLIATTGMDRLAAAFRMLGVPRLFVLQLLLTYRYISVLAGEVARILRAYSLRSPGQKGIHRNAWGPLTGQLILRTFERAQRVYQAMCLRGFSGEYNTGGNKRTGTGDMAFLVIWILFFAAAGVYNIPMLIGSFLMGEYR